MTGKDLEVCERLFAEWARSGAARIFLVCPNHTQELMFRAIFPDAEIRSVQYPNFDAGAGPPPDGPWDIVFVANTMMAADRPGVWLGNFLAAAREVWMQELVRAWRNGDKELDPDTDDITRFTFPRRGHEARVPGAYDLEANPDVRVDEIEFYEDTGAGAGRDCLKFAARVRKAEPVARTPRGRADGAAPAPTPVRKDGRED